MWKFVKELEAVVKCRCVCVCVSRLVEEVKQKCQGVQLQTEDVYMATTYQDFIQMFVRKLRGEDQEEELVIDYVSLSTDVYCLPANPYFFLHL